MTDRRSLTTPMRVALPDGATLEAALALPAAGASPGPAMIVLHEIFGLNDDIRRITRHIADAGYVALAPNLYSHGNKAACLSRVLLAVASNPGHQAVLDDIEATRAALAARDDVDADRIGIIGFCAGGGFALAFAAARPGVGAAAVNYGAVPKEERALAGVCPVVASFGRLDKTFLAQGERLGRHLEALGIPHDVKIYEGVGHSFLSYDNAPGWMAKIPTPMHVGYDEAAAADAWERIFAFFDTHLTGATRP